MHDVVGVALAGASYGCVFAGARALRPWLARALSLAAFVGASLVMASPARGLVGGVLAATLAWSLAASLVPVAIGAIRA